MAQRIRINVGGTLFITQQETLTSYPNTRLARMNTKMTEYDATDGTYYFDRDPECFASILSMYRHRELHFPKYVCAMKMRNEMQFWGIPQSYMSRCCWKTFYEVDEDIDILDKLAVSSDGKASDVESKNFKERVWVFLDDPSSSQAAKIWQYSYLAVVTCSCLLAGFETVSFFRREAFVPGDSFLGGSDFCQMMATNETKTVIDYKFFLVYCYDAVLWLFIAEVACAVFFTVELILGLLVCPSKTKFFKSKVYIVAIMTTISMWFCIFLETNKDLMLVYKSLAIIHGAFKCITVMRVLLFGRLVRVLSAVQVLILALKNSFSELLLLVVCIVMATQLFAMVMFHFEFLYESEINDMFSAMWWAVVTMSTVGYGDLVPVSIQGKLLGSFCSIFGLLLLALPVAIVASNFAAFYNRTNERQRHLLNKNGVKQNNAPVNKIGSVLTLEELY